MSDNVDLDVLRKGRNYLLLGAGLSACMSGMKAAGLFAVGAFPWVIEMALSAFLLACGLHSHFKIRRLETQQAVE